MHRQLTAVLIIACVGCQTAHQASRVPPSSAAPIIDAHLHGFGMGWAAGQDTAWWPKSIPRSVTDSGLVAETIQQLRANRVVKAITSGNNMAALGQYVAAAPDVVVPALMFGVSANVDTLRNRFRRGAVQSLGEVVFQYNGVSAADSSVDKFWSLAEELDAPIGIHIGLGPPGWQFKNPYRVSLSDALQLEPVLARHPKLRIWVMHAGWPLGDQMVALLYSFPTVYVDISVINWYIPRPEFHAYLRRLIDAGFSDRIMYGSDQMIWPASIPLGIEAIQNARFLTEQQKRDILCFNAARFFRMDESVCRT